MLSEEEKKEILADAQSESRRQSFAQASRRAKNQHLSGAEYVRFLQSVQNLFPRQKSAKKIEGNLFKL